MNRDKVEGSSLSDLAEQYQNRQNRQNNSNNSGSGLHSADPYSEITALLDMVGGKICPTNVEAVAGQLSMDLMDEHNKLQDTTLVSQLGAGNSRGQSSEFSERDVMENIFKLSELLNFFVEKVKRQQLYSIADSGSWPMNNAVADQAKLQNPNLPLSEFVQMFKGGTEIALSVLHPVRELVMAKVASLQVDQEEQDRIASLQLDKELNQIDSGRAEEGKEEEVLQYNQPRANRQSSADDKRQQELETLREIYGRNQQDNPQNGTLRVRWFFDGTNEMRQNGTMAKRQQLDQLRACVEANEEELRQVILAKVTNSSLAPRNSISNQVGDQVSAVFDDEHQIQYEPGGQQIGLRKIDMASANKLELAYQSFVENLASNGPDHIETIELEDAGVHFQVIFTKACLDDNIFQIENQNSLVQRQLFRMVEEPRMSIKYTKLQWQATPAAGLRAIDLSQPADQASIAKFCEEAQMRLEDLVEQANASGTGRNQTQNQMLPPPDFLAQPIRLRSTGDNYLLYADKPSNWEPTLMVWPLRQNAYHNLSKQIIQGQELDLIASYSKMKVPRGQSYVINELGPTDYEYKMIEKAFVGTGTEQQNSSAGFGFGRSRSPAQGRIIKIEKIYNPTIFDKFTSELKRTLRKYPTATVWDLTRLLFHGSNTTQPSLIYSSDYGLDNRFANAGMYGTGIYFANNSAYSRNYEHTTTEGVRTSDGHVHPVAYQMFLCLVLTGESVSLQPQRLQVPPLKRDHASALRFSKLEMIGDQASERFDSVANANSSHYIIYDFNKQYPGYLITYV